MRKVILERFETSDEGTFGLIELPGKLFLFAGELPWRENKSNFSCIPAGVYQCEFTYSPKFKIETYELKNVPRRNAIRIHPANYMGDKKLGFKSEVNGCISLGTKILDDGKDQKRLFLSKSAVEVLENFLKKEPFELEIIEKWKPSPLKFDPNKW